MFRNGVWEQVRFALRDFDEAINEDIITAAADAVLVHEDAGDVDVSVEPHKITESIYNADVAVEAMVHGLAMASSCQIELRIKYESCMRCSRVSGGYYEGIIQIRAQNRKFNESELEQCVGIVQEVFSNAFRKGDDIAFISKEETVKGGIDLYVGSKPASRQACNAIIAKFGGTFAESQKLVGQKEGKDIYRVSFSMRLPEFIRGDIVLADGKVLEIHKYDKNVTGIELENGTRVVSKFKHVEKIADRKDARKAVMTMIEGDTVQLLDPDTYIAVTIKKPMFLNAEPGSEVDIIKTLYGMYLLP